MQQATIDGITLEFWDSGTGEPVVFIHGVFIADAFRPLAAEPSLASRYRLITYRRRGYGGSTRPSIPLSLSEQAADCLALLRRLGIARAHVVGHSFGGAVALQLALDAAEAVHSLALLDPALMAGTTAQSYRDSLIRSLDRFHQVDTPTVVHEFTQARWPAYQDVLEQVLPGAFAQAVADAATTFETDLPGLLDWTFEEAEARRVSQPTVVVLGGDSPVLWDRFLESHRLLLRWLPRAESLVIAGTTHLMQLERPGELAEGLAHFYARHPFPS